MCMKKFKYKLWDGFIYFDLKLSELESNVTSLYESTIKSFKQKEFKNIKNKKVEIDYLVFIFFVYLKNNLTFITFLYLPT